MAIGLLQPWWWMLPSTMCLGANVRIRVVGQMYQESDVSQFLFYNIEFQG